MRNLLAAFAALTLLSSALPASVHAADDDAVARAKEMLRRTQEALHQAQAENADLLRAKTDAEQKLQAATKQIDVAQSGSKAAQGALNAKLTAAQSVQTDLQNRLNDADARLAATNAKLSGTASELAARNGELAQVRQMLEQSKSANASCEDKNLKLYSYAETVLGLYKNKGVWAALSQKDPVLGLKEVDVENVVQEYQAKFASQKIKPSTSP
jgi:peptidoglycan hydrolase CwlO-like protein